MGSSINVTTDVLKADPYAWKCVLAMPLVGYNADESKNIICTQSAARQSHPGNAAASSDAVTFLVEVMSLMEMVITYNVPAVLIKTDSDFTAEAVMQHLMLMIMLVSLVLL